mgnify:CR=1 FL=1
MKSYNLLEAKEIIKSFYNVNQINIVEERYTLFLKGIHGIGKTSIVRQVGKELSKELNKDITVHVIRLSQYEDISQLTGKPTCFLKMRNKDGDEIEVSEKYIDIYHKLDYEPIIGSEEMKYTIPDIIKNIKEGDILFFDDYGRQLQHFNNSIMEIINEGKYLSWDLPKGVVTILSGNPDEDGNYQVIESDEAQKDRSEIMNIVFDSKIWILYAEKENIEDIYISFIYNNENLFSYIYNDEKDIETSIKKHSPRKWTKLFKFLSILYGKDYRANIDNIYKYGYLFVGEQISELISYMSDSYSNVCTSKDLLDLTKSETEIDKLIDESIKIHQTVKSYISFRLINYIFANKENLFVNSKKEYSEELSNRVIYILKNKNFEKDIKTNFILSIAKDKDFKDIYSKYKEIVT